MYPENVHLVAVTVPLDLLPHHSPMPTNYRIFHKISTLQQIAYYWLHEPLLQPSVWPWCA